jgi:hypothetical protein
MSLTDRIEYLENQVRQAQADRDFYKAVASARRKQTQKLQEGRDNLAAKLTDCEYDLWMAREGFDQQFADLMTIRDLVGATQRESAVEAVKRICRERESARDDLAEIHYILKGRVGETAIEAVKRVTDTDPIQFYVPSQPAVDKPWLTPKAPPPPTPHGIQAHWDATAGKWTTEEMVTISKRELDDLRTKHREALTQ